jgi:hypothetical protein
MLDESQQAMWCEQRQAERGGANKEMQEEEELNNDSGNVQEKHFNKNRC